MTLDEIDEKARDVARLVTAARGHVRALDWRGIAALDKKVRPIIDTLTALAWIIPPRRANGERDPAEVEKAQEARHLAEKMVLGALEKASALVYTPGDGA